MWLGGGGSKTLQGWFQGHLCPPLVTYRGEEAVNVCLLSLGWVIILGDLRGPNVSTSALPIKESWRISGFLLRGERGGALVRVIVISI